MKNLRKALSRVLSGHVCLVGLGNTDFGDDGSGVRLAEKLRDVSENPGGRHQGNENASNKSAPWSQQPANSTESATKAKSQHDREEKIRILIGGLCPEQYLSWLGKGGFDHVLFLDAVEFGGRPGEVVLLSSTELCARYPQMSTHKISLGLLSKLIEVNGHTQVWLLGVQPESLHPTSNLSATVASTLDLLTQLLGELVTKSSREKLAVPL